MFHFIFVVLNIFPNGLLYILNLFFKLIFFFQIFLSLLLNNPSILIFLFLQRRLFFCDCFFKFKIFSDKLHVLLLKVNHLFQILKEIVKCCQILLISCFILRTKFQNNLQSLFLKQTLTKLCDYILFLFKQIIENFTLFSTLLLFLLMQILFC